jgi:UDP-glucose 4-epimerase
MRIVITGATGNVGTSLLEALAREGGADSIVAVARRRPRLPFAHVQFVTADVGSAPLEPIFAGADAVVHLAWQIQPSRHVKQLDLTNVLGSRRVFAAAAASGVRSLVVASSIGAYSPAEPDGPELVSESWPTRGIPSSLYSRQKVQVESMLDQLEQEHSQLRIVRMRPALIFKRSAGAEIHRYFAGPLVPRALLRPSLIPLIPDVRGLKFQALHSHDAGEAFRLAALSDVRGPVNIAAKPVLTMPRIAALLAARPVPLPGSVLRAAVAASYRLHLQPTDPGWFDLALRLPLLSTARAEQVLGWRPRHSSLRALSELLDGMRRNEGLPTPPLSGRHESVTV